MEYDVTLDVDLGDTFHAEDVQQLTDEIVAFDEVTGVSVAVVVYMVVDADNPGEAAERAQEILAGVPDVGMYSARVVGTPESREAV